MAEANMKQEPLSSSEYAKQLGLVCPVCGEHGASGGPIEVDAGVARQELTCGECGAGWQDQYSLVGYAQLELGS